MRQVTRPERIRERNEVARRQIALEGGLSPSDQAAAADSKTISEAEAVNLMLKSQGWQIVQSVLVERCAAIWNQFQDPTIVGEPAETLRLQAIKYSGIEDVITDILTKGERVQRRDL